MATMLAVLLAVTALAVCAIREDTPTSTTPRQVVAGVRAAGWRRVAWLVACALLGGMAIVLFTAVRTGLYGALLAVAALACALASAASIDKRPVRVRRLEISA